MIIMKEIMKPMLFALLLTISLLSCNKEELFVEPVEVVEEDSADNTDTDTSPEDTATDETDTSLPCDFTLDNVEPNSTIIINCVLDLEGKTVNLPANVEINYEGGDIINGTLNFGDNGIIDGDILNSTLTVTGSNLHTKDPVFNFDPKRWGIVEGEVSQDVATTNSEILRSLIFRAKELGISTFKLDVINAYFYGDQYWVSPIELPSDFNLEMTDNTRLNVFLNSHYTSLIRIKEVKNVKVSGGILRGYRDKPGNDDINTTFDFLIAITSGENIVVENVHMSMATEDGLTVNSSRHAYEADYAPSKNVLVKGCTFDTNRRLNLSITDGQDIIVEDCTFLNAGIDTPYSTGTAPRYAIDIEPVGHGDDQPFQKVDRVIIRNNVETGSAAGGIVIADGDDILVTGNSFEKGVYMTGASNVSIVDNPYLSTVVIGNIDVYSTARNKNTIVSGNTIKDSNTGIQVTNQDVQIFDNEIINCGLGMQLYSLKDSRIYNNTITSIGKEGQGINAINYVDNVVIENNTIDVDNKAFFWNAVNSKPEEQGYTFTFKDNTVTSTNIAIFQWTYGGQFIGNNINESGIRLDGVNNFTLDGNTIVSNNYYGLEIGQDATDNLTIKNNRVECLNPSAPQNAIYLKSNNSAGTNKNISITGNTTKTLEYFSGVYVSGYNGIEVSDNIGSSGQVALIYYRGDNSTFSNNKTFDGAVKNDIVGSNNSITD